MAITTLEKTKLVLGINNNDYDARITALIPMIEQEYLDIRNKPFDNDELGAVVYPTNAELTAIKMIGHNLFSIRDTNKKSESLGDYSVSFQDVSGMSAYPSSIIGSIRKYARAI